MNSNSKLLFLAYILVGAVNIFASQMEYQLLQWATKPLLMALLMLWFWGQSSGKGTRVRKLILLGLGFSWLGDVLLMWRLECFFLFGLLSFLATHLCYLAVFVGFKREKQGWCQARKALVLPFILFLVGFNAFLLPGMPIAMQVPVTIYGVVIVSMAFFALNLGGKLQKNAFLLVFLGAMLFLTSDLLLAINKFKHPIPYSSVWIMLTYLLGQYSIAKGGLTLNELTWQHSAENTL